MELTEPRNHKHGLLTAKVARKLGKELKKSGYNVEVLYDHGHRLEQNVGTIVGWYGSAPYRRGSALSQLDIAIIDHDSARVAALVEIEDKSDRPKSLLADALATLVCDLITFNRHGKRRELQVGPWTTVIIMGKTPAQRLDRIQHLADKVTNIKSVLSTAEYLVGDIVIKPFATDSHLRSELIKHVESALKRCKSFDITDVAHEP